MDAPGLEAKLRQTQLRGMLMERALHDRGALWQARALDQTVPLDVSTNAKGVTFTASVSAPGNISGDEIVWEILINGEVVHVVKAQVPEDAHEGDSVALWWSLSPYRLSLA